MLDLLTNAPRRLEVAGRVFTCSCLCLRELGVIQRWLRDQSRWPTVAVEDELEFHDPAGRHRLQLEAVAAERDGGWPPPVGSAEGNRIVLRHPDGQRLLVELMLRKHHPGLADRDIDAVLLDVTPDDLAELLAAAFGDRDLGPPSRQRRPAPRPGTRPPSNHFGDLFQKLAMSGPHWSHAVIGDLTYPQILILGNGGKLPRPNRIDFTNHGEIAAYLQGSTAAGDRGA